jgi:hypothetical protein
MTFEMQTNKKREQTIMDNNSKAINLFWIIFMGYICVEKKIKTSSQGIRTPAVIGYDITKPIAEPVVKKTGGKTPRIKR